MANPQPDTVWSAARILALAPDERSIPDARGVLRKGALGAVEREADGRGWCAVCKGRVGEYRVWVLPGEDDDEDFVCQCTCPSRKSPCKHALALLLYLLDHPELRAQREGAGHTSADFEMLLRAAFRDPKDDTPRLVLADYLEEAGQADRARLIRVQCELARLPSRSRRPALRAEEKALLAALRPAFHPLPEQVREVEVVRGFLRLGVSAYWWGGGVAPVPPRVADLFRDGWVEAVRVQTYGGLPTDLLAVLRLAGELDFTPSDLDESGLLALASAAHGEGSRVARVKVDRGRRPMYESFVAARVGTAAPAAVPRPASRADAHYHALDAEQLGVLVRSGRLDGLHTLHVDGPIGDAGAELLAGAGGLSGLHHLSLSDSRIGPAGAAALAGAAGLGGLRGLSLVGRAMDDEAFAALCRAGGFPELTELEVAGGQIGDAAAAALGRARHLTRLAETRWSSTQLTPDGAAAIVGSANLPALAACRFEGNAFEPECWLPLALNAADRDRLQLRFPEAEVVRTASAEGVALRVTAHDRLAGRRLGEMLDGVARCGAAGRVAGLTLTGFRMDRSAVRSLAAFSRDGLEKLELPNNALGNDGAAALADAFRGHRPVSLNLADNNIRRTGAEALAGSAVLSRVEVLDLSRNNVGLPGLLAVVGSPHAAALRRLLVQATGLTNPQRKELRKRSRAAVEV